MGIVMSLIIGVFLIWFNNYIGQIAEASKDHGAEMAVVVVRAIMIIFLIFDMFI